MLARRLGGANRLPVWTDGRWERGRPGFPRRVVTPGAAGGGGEVRCKEDVVRIARRTSRMCLAAMGAVVGTGEAANEAGDARGEERVQYVYVCVCVCVVCGARCGVRTSS